MKPETKTADIRSTLTTHEAENASKAARAHILAVFDAGGDTLRAIEHAKATRQTHQAASAALARIPAPRRKLAADTVTAAEAIARAVAVDCGSGYSGQTDYRVQWGNKAAAETSTAKGEQYSRGCIYKKTDADHIVTLDPAGVSLLVEQTALRHASKRDGLRLIALYPDNSAVWVKSHGKGIISETGWIAGTPDGSVCYHSTKSAEHARAGLAKKRAIQEVEKQAATITAKENRRARLVARLCGGISATIADARAHGYCGPGIQAFQARFGIGDAAPLPDLIRTGDPSAVALALSIARKAGKRELATA